MILIWIEDFNIKLSPMKSDIKKQFFAIKL